MILKSFLTAVLLVQFTAVPVANAGRTLAEEELLAEKLKMISGDLRIVLNRPETIILQIPPSQITPTTKAFAGPSPIVWARYNPSGALGRIDVTKLEKAPNGNINIIIRRWGPDMGKEWGDPEKSRLGRLRPAARKDAKIPPMPFPFPPTAGSSVLTVSELNRAAKLVLEQAFPLLWVSGEISNLMRAASGHWYFSLKDGQAQVRCAMFRHKSQYLDWAPENGMQVEVRALVTLYEARGEFQLTVEAMRRSGLGALYEAFEKLKQRLAQEGLFAEAHKKPLPAFPRQIGVVTSPDAAALRDVLTTLSRRMPSIPVVLYPTPVQGEGAAQKIAAAIRAAGERRECDVLILCRGGGSIEDLWQFNLEIVARAVFESPIPIICGVGHETDFTIADFVADRRAPTPTAAAEMASPNRADLLQRLAVLAARIERRMAHGLEQRMQQVDYLSRRLLHPGERINARLQHLEHLRLRLNQAAAHALDGRTWRLQQFSRRLAAARPDTALLEARQKELGERLRLGLERQLHHRQATLQRLAASLHHLNPHAVLERGFSIVEAAGGEIVRDSGQLAAGEEIRLTFAHGGAKARVTEKS